MNRRGFIGRALVSIAGLLGLGWLKPISKPVLTYGREKFAVLLPATVTMEEAIRFGECEVGAVLNKETEAFGGADGKATKRFIPRSYQLAGVKECSDFADPAYGWKRVVFDVMVERL